LERKGGSYDVGRVMAGNWRPEFDPKVVRGELEITGARTDRPTGCARAGRGEWDFYYDFLSPTAPFNEDPSLDMDLNSYSLVQSYEHGRHGTTYPEMAWEPKEAFKAVAEFYKK
jgi:hypothetical protein